MDAGGEKHNEKVHGAIRLRDSITEEVYYGINMAVVLAELPDEDYAAVERFTQKCKSERTKS